jgi:UDP-N-acetyl-D-mannosaminuronic acid dehydrogenase
MGFPRDVAIVGGCGRVGLPLGLSFAAAGLSVALYDKNQAQVDLVASGRMPFAERGAQELLDDLSGTERLLVTADRAVVSEAEHIVVVVGTPVDEHLNPDPGYVLKVIDELLPVLRDGQHLVMRSTVYPGVTAMVEQSLARHDLDIDVSFCPERISEGHAIEELRALPQIVSGRNLRAVKRAEGLFRALTESIVKLDVEEAELAKLFTNTWRYVKFAAANQMYMIANDFGLDFERIRAALTHDYPRAADLPGAGLTAGPCLLKDTMQLAAFNNNNFTLGHASMMINEGLPLYIVARIERRFDLSRMCVGLLGMAFKAESDDARSSLSYKLRRLLRIKAERVLCTDPYVEDDPQLRPLDEVLEKANLLVIGAPHRVYADLDVDVPVIDIWNLRGQGVRV